MASGLALHNLTTMPRRARTQTSAAILEGMSERLKWVREIVEPNQSECARLMGIVASTWNKYEAGTRTPDIFVLIEFCNRFRCSLDFLYRGLLDGLDRDLERKLVALHPQLVLDQHIPNPGQRRGKPPRDGMGSM